MYSPEKTGGGGGRKESKIERAVRLAQELYSGRPGVFEDHKNAWRTLPPEEHKQATALHRRLRRKR